jgi:hypothetical protein
VEAPRAAQPAKLNNHAGARPHFLHSKTMAESTEQ